MAVSKEGGWLTTTGFMSVRNRSRVGGLKDTPINFRSHEIRYSILVTDDETGAHANRSHHHGEKERSTNISLFPLYIGTEENSNVIISVCDWHYRATSSFIVKLGVKKTPD